MWAGRGTSVPRSGDNFDQAHRLFRRVRAILEARRRHEALRRGATTDLYAETAGPGLYVYRRESATDSALVAVNSSNAPLAQAVTTAVAAGHGAGGRARARLGRHGGRGRRPDRAPAGARRAHLRVRCPRARPRCPPPTALHVESVSPAHDRAVNDRWSPLRVVFDRAVDPARLAGAFSVTPAAPGVWQVAGREARFFPYEPWTQRADLRLGAGHHAGARWTARACRRRFDARFRTVAYSTGVTVPSGYVADRIARQNLTAPEGILPAPWLGPDVMLVADAGRDRLFELTVGGDLGHFLGDSRWTKPEGLARAADGSLAVTDPAGLFLADAHRMTTLAVGAAGRHHHRRAGGGERRRSSTGSTSATRPTTASCAPRRPATPTRPSPPA